MRNNAAKECGKILWESKYTKAFAGGWIAKLKADQQEAGAELAVLATVALPKEIANFGPYGKKIKNQRSKSKIEEWVRRDSEPMRS